MGRDPGANPSILLVTFVRGEKKKKEYSVSGCEVLWWLHNIETAAEERGNLPRHPLSLVLDLGVRGGR